MNSNEKKLCELLPSIYRICDIKEQNGQLRELLAVIASQIDLLDENMAQLYDDMFIETCADWVIPYIGDLIGYRSLHDSPEISRQRAEVANTICYRRRKGTAAMLEQLARDVTGWNARVVEFFQLLAATQYMNHIRLDNKTTPDLRQWEMLEYINTPFNSVPHTVDVRRIESERGKFNIPNIGIFLWRLGSYSLKKSPACIKGDGRYFFSPLGNDAWLYTRPEREDEVTHLAERMNVPMPISRRILKEHLSDYYGTEKSILIKINDNDEEISIDKIEICDLSDIQGGEWAHKPSEGKVAVDPVLGRIAFCPTIIPENDNVKVTFHYGFSKDMGGGEYSRAATFEKIQDNKMGLLYVGTPSTQLIFPEDFLNIQAAMDDLENSGVIEIRNNARYEETLKKQLDTGVKIELRAADKKRPTIIMNGNLEISGNDHSELTLNGLLISGGAIHIPAILESGSEKSNKLNYLRIKHCTLVPGISLDGDALKHQEPSLIIESAGTVVEIEDSIVGGIRVAQGASIRITNSIVDSVSESNIAYSDLGGQEPGGEMVLKNCTIIGKVNTTKMVEVSNTIFASRRADINETWDAPVKVERLQEGCVRFSYLPLNSKVPRRYYCHEESEGIYPIFSSKKYGDPGYCQLSLRCPINIRRGADDDAEMGAFHDLYQPQREINLRVRLGEYLRFGMEAGIFYFS